MSKFTPGPWTHGHVGLNHLWVGPSHEHKFVATVPWDTNDARDNARDNAALIAAAPAMYEALRLMRDVWEMPLSARMRREDAEQLGVAWQAMTNALAKAEA